MTRAARIAAHVPTRDTADYAILARPVELFEPYKGRCIYIRDSAAYIPLCCPNVSYARADLDFTDTRRICKACKRIATTILPFTAIEVEPNE